MIYRWKTLNEGYNFVSNFISIRCLHVKLWVPKVVGVLTLTILGLPLGSFETKCHLDVGLVERRRVYDKGEGGGFLQVRVVVSLVSPVSPSCPWLVLAPKVFQLCTCCNPTLAKCGGEAQHSQSWDLESSGTLECLEFNSKAQNTSH